MKITWTIFILFSMTWSILLRAQENLLPSRTPVLEPIQNLYNFGIDFYSNTYGFKNLENEVKQPAYYGNFSFFGKQNLYLSLSHIYTDNSNDSLDGFASQTDISAGYSYDQWKPFRFMGYYSYSFFSVNSNELNQLFPNQFYVEAVYDKEWYNTGVNVNYLFGNYQTWITTWEHSVSLILDGFLFRQTTWMFEPELSLSLGNYTYLNTYISDHPELLTSFDNNYATNLKEELLNDYLEDHPIIKYRIDNAEDNTLKDFFTDYILLNPEPDTWVLLEETLEEDHPEKMQLTSITSSLPAYIIYGNFTLSASLTAMYLMNQPKYLDTQTWYLLWSVGLNYTLSK